METKCVLVIGVRRACYKAALALGHEVVLWSDGPLKPGRKKGLLDWIEAPFQENMAELTPAVLEALSKHKIQRVLANTEEAVLLGARVRHFLGLKNLAVNVTERFRDKFIMKNFAKDCGIPITKYKLIEPSTKATELVEELNLPLVIKPVDQAGAKDVVIAKTFSDVEKFMKPGLLAEAFVEGSEVSVETFVQDGKPIFHNFTEYLHQWRKSVVPAQLPKELQAQIVAINDEVIQRFGVDRGVTHAEYYLTKNGPLFGEIAIRPPGGYYMDLIQRVYEFNAWETYVNLSCEKPVKINQIPNGCAAVYVMHPGAGKVKAIHGVEDVKKNVDGIFEFSMRREVGDEIQPHETTSNEVGHILFWAKDRSELDRKLEYIETHLVFELS